MFQVKKKYDATIQDAGLMTTKSNKPMAFVELSVKADDGSLHRQTWFGGLSESSQEYTASALLKMGFMGNSFDDLKKGVMAFDGTKERTVEFGYRRTKNEVTGKYEDDTTKIDVKWVNLKSKGINKFDGNTGINNQAALFAKVKSELGVKKTTPKPSSNNDW